MMRLAAILFLLPAFAMAEWRESPVTVMGTAPNPRAAVVFYAWSGQPAKNDMAWCRPNELCELDLTQAGIPADVVAVELVAMLNVTQPTQRGLCWVEAQPWPSPGDADRWTFRARSSDDGLRDGQSASVRVVGGKVRWTYRFWGTHGAAAKPYPDGCSFMLRVSASAYWR